MAALPLVAEQCSCNKNHLSQKVKYLPLPHHKLSVQKALL